MFKSLYRLNGTGKTFRFAIVLALVFQLCLPWQTQANPVGGNVIAGQADISGGTGTLTVNQASQKAIINWQDFSIGHGELTKFVQPNAASAVLNRVVGSNLSGIYGTLQSNGQVYLINPNGIVIGPTGVVKTGGFVASTQDIDNSQFLAGGDLTFKGNSTAKVVNLGKIGASTGDVILIAQEVENAGEIKAPNGVAALAAGNEVLVKASGTERLFVQAGKGRVSNGGLIESATAELKAAGGNEYALAINNSGTVRATGLVNEGGRILLKSANGKVRNAGTLTAKSARDAKGDVRVLGKSVELASTSKIEAPGGFVETSGETVLIADGSKVTTLAEDGSFGTWLIDPTNFTVSAGNGAQTTSGIGATTLSTNLGSTSVQIATPAGGAEPGHIYVNAPVSWAAATTLTLTAHGSIYVNAPITASNAAGKVALQYGQGAVAAGNLSTYYVNAPVNLQAGLNFSTKLGSDGTTLDYRVITALGAAGSMTGTDLQGINGNLSGRFVLGADIDASATSGWNSGAGFQPIAGSGYFTGTFDGLGHNISGLTINRPTSSHVGLFAFISAARIANVNLRAVSMTGQDYVGALAARTISSSTIMNSSVTGSVNGSGSEIGGMVGINNGSTIANSYAAITVAGGDNDTAGLVGENIGGGIIINCYATGSVTGGRYTGGLVAYNVGGSSIINSYAAATVTGTTATGALVGYNPTGGSISGSFWDSTIGGSTGIGLGSGSVFGTSGLTTAQMKTQSNFTGAGWDFAGTWRMIDGGTYPLLTALSSSISGTAYSDAGVTNVGSGVSIGVGVNGVSLGTATTTAGGAFQLLVQGTPTQGLVWIDNSVSVKGTSILTSLTTQNLDLWGGYVRAADGTSNSIASTAKGALSDTDILFTSSGNNLTVASNTKFLALGAYTLNGNITAQGTGTLGFNGTVTLTSNSALTTANQNINFGSSIAGNYGLTLAAGTGNITTHAVNTTVNVGTFRLDSGNWSQNSATLPNFVASDFQFAGGTFLRVKGGNGTTATPYQITDVYGLQGVASFLAQEFQLANNIDASATSGWNTGAGFSPIGSGSGGGRFSGRFDGLGYTINGLVINRLGSNEIGLFGASSGTIQNVGLVGGSMVGGQYTGSLVGRNYGNVTRGFSTANVTANGQGTGGLVGIAFAGSIITQSYATGNVAGTFYVGGLVGLNANAGGFGSPGIIQQSYATGSVSGTSAVGGLVGQNFSGTTITESYATGGLPLSGGGIGSVTNSYAVGDGITLAQLEAALPAGFDSTVWGNAGNHSTPYIKAIALSRVYIDSDPGTVRLYQIIQNVNELQGMQNNLAGRYALGNAINASATSGWNSGLGFSPIGNFGNSGFTGTFDGLGHVISGLTINRSAQDYVGLFGLANTGSVLRNVALSGGSLSGKFYVGGLVGYNQGNVSGSYATGTVDGLSSVGGLAGVNLGDVSGSYATGAVSSAFSGGGGLVGVNFATVSTSYATGTVSGDSNIGGLLGQNSGSMSNSYASGAVSGTSEIGGLVGYLNGAVDRSYSTGAVSGTSGINIGGLVGNHASGSVTNSYWDIESSGLSISDGGVGKTTAQMKQLATFSGWDISSVGGSTSVWRIYEGYTAPLLRSFLKAVTASVDAGGSKVYDGTTSATGASYSLSDPLASPGILGTATYVLSNRNVGSRTATLSELYSNQQGYDISFQSAAYTVNLRTITLSTSNVNRGYDGTTDAAGTAIVTLGSLATGDTLGAGSFTFDNKNVGTGKTVFVDSVTINDGNSGNNYTITLANNTNSSISAAALAVTAQTDSRGYNGTNSSSVGPVVTGTLYDAVGAAATQVFYDKNVGTGKTLTASGLVVDDGNGGNNYAITYVDDTTGVITVAGLTVTAQGDNRGYNGDNSSSVGPVLTGTIFGSDTVGTAATQVFDDKNVGTVKTLTASGLVINDGNSGNNYTISYVTDTTGVITAASLTVTAQTDSRGYDGTTDSSVGPVLTGTIFGIDTVGTAAAQAYDSRNAGTGKTLKASGLVISDGNGGDNYAITYVNDTTGVITAASLTVTAQTDSRVYNGTVSSSVGPIVTGTIFGSDTVGTVATQIFDSKGVGTDKTLTASGLIIDDGNGGNNYAIDYVDDMTGVITQATLFINADAGQNKIYGNADPTLAFTATGLFGTDAVSGSQVRVAGENVGLYAISQGSLDAGSNYLISYTGENFGITPRPITVTAGSGSSIYGQSAVNPGIALTAGSFAFADTLGSLGFGNDFSITNSSNVGNYPIRVTGDSSNYAVTRIDGNWSVTNPLARFAELLSKFQASEANDENDTVDSVTGFAGRGNSTFTYSSGGPKVPGAWVHVSSGDVE